MLEGEILYREGKFDAAFSELRRAVALEDGLNYDEPWGWMQPVRHALGALLLEQGRVDDAEAVFRADLGLSGAVNRACVHPDNVWALRGLHDCLVARGETAERAIIAQKLALAQARADQPVAAACGCAQRRVRSLAMTDLMFEAFALPCGAVLRNRLAKAAMSDSLGDGSGQPTAQQQRLYERWAKGGAAVAIVGEVQSDPHAAEKPGNLVLRRDSDLSRFRALAAAGTKDGAHLWLQLGHAGALTHPPIGQPRGPSALDLPGLVCEEMTGTEIAALPDLFAETAVLAKELGFTGVEIHAAHGFLLSQFLSPLFNRRGDRYGGPIQARMRIVLEVVAAVRAAVGPAFPVALKLNATDQLEGGLAADEALVVADALAPHDIDLLDISGGTYFPGAASASDAQGLLARISSNLPRLRAGLPTSP